VSRVEPVGLDHVLLAMPVGGERAARRFYGELLGLREVPKPEELGERNGCWFVGSGIAIHLGVDQRFMPAKKAHPALLVADLIAAREALGAAGAPLREDDTALPVRRCYVEDPFGNRIELIDARYAGFTDPAGRGWLAAGDGG
jgi:catechol 2,3-dioxygenase-like lactoylglutathione lyase family enzyme